MKKTISLLLLCFFVKFAAAQDAKEKVERACLDYIEGFYEGDTTKLARSLKPSLYKYGYWKNKTTNNYDPDGYMTYQQALDYAKKVMEKKSFAKADAPKKVEVFDIMNTMAAAKVTAWWGVDYILLAKQDGRWMIEQVLWEGPLENKN
ncbi:MAG: nuclear transport factor 2 family protein [Ferruginibacter sp.]|nr:nuclear transport factor 2 family protein [Chitinophagaceae bacterium]